MTHDEIQWWLRKLPGLADAPEGPLASLAEHWESVVVTGRTFLAEGAVAEGLYMLVEGQVEVVRTDPTGEAVVVGMVQPPDLLGFTGVLSRAEAIASARARGRAVLLRMPAATARELLLRDDAVSAVLRRALLVALARRLAEANRLLSRLSSSVTVRDAEAPLVV